MPRDRSVLSLSCSRLVLLLTLLNVAAAIDRMIFAALAPVLQPALGLSDSQLGLVQGPAFGLAYGLALPLAGWLVDTVGAWRTLRWAALVWTFGLIVSAASNGLLLLMAGRTITGIGQSVLTPAALTLILATAPPARAGRSISLFTGAGTIGRAASFAIAGALLAVLGSTGSIRPWSAVLLVVAAGNLMLYAIGYGMMRDDRPIPTRGTRDAFRSWPRRTSAVIAPTVVAALASVVAVQALAGWMAIVVVRGFDASPASAAIAIGGIGLVAGPLGHLLGGLVVDRAPRAGLAQAVVALVGIPAVVTFVAADGLLGAYLGLAMTITACGASATIGLVRVQRLIPTEIRGSANGLFMALVALIGISGGPALVPLVAGLAGGIAGGLIVVIASAAAITAVAALACAREHWR